MKLIFDPEAITGKKIIPPALTGVVILLKFIGEWPPSVNDRGR
jgi:hypothetical protein